MKYSKSADAADNVLKNKHIYMDALAFLLNKAVKEAKPSKRSRPTFQVTTSAAHIKTINRAATTSTAFISSNTHLNITLHIISSRFLVIDCYGAIEEAFVITVPPGRLKKITRLKSDPNIRPPSNFVDQSQARIQELEAQLASLQAENATLKQEVSHVRELYQAATAEASVNSASSLERRRTALLRSQIIQLQREVIAQRDSLIEKEHSGQDVDEDVNRIKELVKGILTEDTSKYSPRHIDSLKQTLQITSAISKRLNRHTVRDRLTSREEERTPAVEFLSEFICPKRRKELRAVSLADVVSGRIEHLNLRHVARLERQLGQLYGDLAALRSSLANSFEPFVVPDLPQHVNDTFDRTMKGLVSAMNALISVSVLVPAAPLPDIDKGAIEIPTASEVAQYLPNMSAGLRSKVEEAITVLLKAMQAYEDSYEGEKSALETELKFHRDLYIQHTEHITSLVDKMEEARKTIVEEVQGVGDSIADLRTKLGSLVFTQDAVRQFLADSETTLKEVSERVEGIVGSGPIEI
ncbi:hypothetical protein HDV00_000658 [Rhizophlyctis rosea]|nr:hypothetical protein HDV00_000658 [Rhizophlyctis rosea]